MKFKHSFFFLATTALSAPSSVLAFNLGNDTHEFELGLRPRYAEVKENGEDGRAASLLMRFSLSSTWTRNFSTLLEYDNIESGFEDEHRDGQRFNGKPLIPDSPGDEINQALLRWQGRQLDVVLGRQRIELANQRFVGSVSYWQNDQTYDALRAKYQLLTMSSAQYIYIGNVNTYWGEDAGYFLSPDDVIYEANDGIRPAAARGDQAHKSHLLHLEFREWDYSQLLAWYYQFENETTPRLSNNTFGVGYRFNYKADVLKYIVEADIAHQELTEFSASNIPYYRLEAGIGFQSVELMLNQEYLGSDQNQGFITPLGSNNDFQGWADMFFWTPDDGVVDTHLQVDWRFNPFRVDARYHFFRAAEGGEDYGEEFDVDFIWKLSRKNKISLRFADFRSDNPDFEDRRSASLSWTYNM